MISPHQPPRQHRPLTPSQNTITTMRIASRREEMGVVGRQHSRRDDTAARLVGMDGERVAAIDATLLLAEDGDVSGRITAGLRAELRIVAHIVPAFGTTDGEHQDISAALACCKEGEYFGGTTKSCEPSTLPCESICAPRQQVDEHSCFYTRRERVQWIAP